MSKEVSKAWALNKAGAQCTQGVLIQNKSRTSPGTGGCGYGGCTLHGRDEGWLEVKQVAGEVRHAAEAEGQEQGTLDNLLLTI